MQINKQCTLFFPHTCTECSFSVQNSIPIVTLEASIFLVFYYESEVQDNVEGRVINIFEFWVGTFCWNRPASYLKKEVFLNKFWLNKQKHKRETELM